MTNTLPNIFSHTLNKFCPKKINVNFMFTRHAETCANVLGESYIDRVIEPNRKKGYNMVIPTENYTVKGKQGLKQIPYLKELYDQTFKFHTCLSYIGMQQAILFGVKFARNRQFDLVISSSSLRTIMTSLFGLRGTKYQIYPVPYIGEEQFSEKIHFQVRDTQNQPVESKTLKRYIDITKDWLGNNWIKRFADIEIMEILLKIENTLNSSDSNDNNEIKTRIYNLLHNEYNENNNVIDFYVYWSQLDELTKSNYVELDKAMVQIMEIYKNRRSVPVNFELLDHFEKIVDINKGNFDNFFNRILPAILNPNSSFKGIEFDNIRKKSALGQQINILCLSHGVSIHHHITTLLKNPNLPLFYNTQTWQHNITFDENCKPVFSYPEKVYPGILMRSNYENFEDLQNINPICDKEMGLLNMIIAKKMDKPKYKEYNEFYNKNITKYDKSLEQAVIFGGSINYEHKYIKYKLKYLDAKNRIN